MIIIDKEHIQNIKTLINNISKRTKLYFLTDISKNEFQSQFREIKQSYSNHFSMNEIKLFQSNLIFQTTQKNANFLTFIKPTICGYILLQSLNLTQRDKYSNKEDMNYEYKDFILIRNVGETTNLYLNVNDQLLYILKKFYIDDFTSKRRCEREIDCYQKIGNKHPFISRYFGTFKHHEIQFIVIEYIEKMPNKTKLDFNEKIKIIIELLLSVEYVHLNGIIIRDLKWDNVIIDTNHDLHLIDFDLSKSIENNDNDNNDDYEEIMTADVGSYLFAAPEQKANNNYSYKVDLYSVGMIINLIITEKVINNNDFLNDLQNELPSFPGLFLFITNFYINLLNDDPEKRPNIATVINDFLLRIPDLIKLCIVKNEGNKMTNLIKMLTNTRFKYLTEMIEKKEPSSFVDISDIYHYIGVELYKGLNIQKNIEKALYYANLSADLNNSRAQRSLGIHYAFKRPDINKALYYLSLSANQNNAEALYNIGDIYFEGLLLPKDIGKAKYYYDRCGQCKDYLVLVWLGFHYIKPNKIIDKNKSIYYFELASRLHNPISQYILGYFYFAGQILKRDIDKAIHYFHLSGNQGFMPSKIMSNPFLPGIEPIDTKELGFDYSESKLRNSVAYMYYKDNINENNIYRAIEYFTISANENDSDALHHLGVIYMENEKVRDINKAIHYLNLASNNNYSTSQLYLGINYLSGQYIPRNANKGIPYLKLSAANNNTDALFWLGLQYYDGINVPKDLNKCVNYLTIAAQKGNSNAQIYLGYIHYQGYYTKDIPKAIHYFNLAANQNNHFAQIYLSLIYLFEKPYININKGLKLVNFLANKNYSVSQYILGEIYLKGDIIKRDINKAIHYLSLSTKSEANLELGLLYYDGQYISKNTSKAIHYLNLAAKKNNREAQFILGRIYFFDEYLKDINKSIFYMTLSANQNYHAANHFLGLIYYEGKYVPKNINEAIRRFKEASNMDNQLSKNNLGVIYLNGIGVKKNVSLAIEYFEDAIRKENDYFASCNLARIFYFGIECKRNIQKAIELFTKALYIYPFPTGLYLYWIYKYDENFRNLALAQKCRNEFLQKFKIDLCSYYDSKEISEKCFHNLKNFSFEYKIDTKGEEFAQLIDVHLIQRQNNNKVVPVFLRNRQNINELFYQGFDIPIN